MTTHEGPFFDRAITLRRKYHKEQRLASGVIDSIPFVDIALLLFLFIMLSHLVALSPGVPIELPSSAFVGGADYTAHVVFISQNGQLFFGDERTTLHELEASLSQITYDNKNVSVLLQADKQVPYETLVSIYNLALNAGVPNVILGTQSSRLENTP